MSRDKLVRSVSKYGLWAVYALFLVIPIVVLAGGSDDCPGLAIVALPYNDSGTTLGGNNTNNAVPASCNGSYTQTAGPDKIYSITVGAGNSVTFSVDPTGANWDPSIYLLSTCTDGNTCSAGWGDDNGGSNVTEVVGPLTLPAGTYYFYVDSFYATGALSAGTYDLSVTGNLGSGSTPTSTATNTPTATATPTETATPTATATATATMVPSVADLDVQTSASPNPVAPGGTLTYDVVVENTGPDGATNVMLTDTLPLSVTLSSTNTTQGTCMGTTVVTCDIGSMASGAQVTVTLVVMAPMQPTILTNVAQASATETDPTPANNSSTSAVTVANPTALSLTTFEGERARFPAAGYLLLAGLFVGLAATGRRWLSHRRK